MADEKWLEEAKDKIDREVDLQLWSLEHLAVQENLDREWVLETFASKLAYKIKTLN